MKRIMFVDDEPEVLRGLKRMLRSKRNQWATAYVESGPEALDLLDEADFDVIVSDSRMPIMDGAKLLEKVKERHPRMVRIILSGHSEQNTIMRTVKVAHQYLVKPIDQDDLFEVLGRALALGQILRDNALASLIASLGSLPGLPTIYTQLVEAIESDDISLETIGEIIQEDMGMSATILKLVNSAFFGIPRKIQQPAQAVSLLGLDVIKSLVLSYQLFSTLNSKQLKKFSFEGLWRHSTSTAGLAKAIAQEMGLDRPKVDEAYVAALLHDIGKLLLGMVIGDNYNEILDKVRQGNQNIHSIELDSLGSSHAEAGAYLMGLWGMPQNVILAIAYHHRPSMVKDVHIEALTAVHVANVLEHYLVVINQSYIRPELDLEYIENFGLTKQVGVWKQICEAQLKAGEEDGQ